MIALNKRRFLQATIAGLGVAFAGKASAEEYPSRPIHLIVPFTPGGGTDRTARILAQKLEPMLGQPVIVENHGGASGSIGTNLAAKAAPDGYTWVLGSDPPFTINQHLRTLPYDPLRDFVPVSLLIRVPLVLIANPKMTANSVQEIIKAAKGNPGKMTISSSGNGSSGHLAAEVFMFATGTKFLHVPFKGQAEAVTDVLAGRIDLNFTAIADVLSLVKSGALKVIVNGSPERFEGLPDVPTMQELGYPGFDVSAFHGLLMPTGVPQAIVDKVNVAVDAVLREVSGTFKALGLFPVGGKAERLTELLKSDSDRWATIIRQAGITGD
jgi:tripartite-type tricarboxylate transporter receptor subunit TctC